MPGRRSAAAALVREGTRPAHLKLCDTHNSTLVRLVPNYYGTPVQVVVNERNGLDFFFSVVCR